MKEYEASALFEAVLRKAIAPGIKLGDGDVKAYYESHRANYVTPELIRIRGLVFSSAKAAEATADTLQKGADFQWVAGRAEGQVDANTAGVLSFDGRPILTTELPEGVQKAVAGAKSGDVRLYASPENHFYALAVQEVIGATARPFEEVRSEIAKTVLDRKIEQAIEEYAAKLRGLSDVKVYLQAR
jgi:hypothetical protein